MEDRRDLIIKALVQLGLRSYTETAIDYTGILSLGTLEGLLNRRFRELFPQEAETQRIVVGPKFVSLKG